jgi:translation initiation factor 2 beta subunit (eIF-2beta)/eIF-5
MSDDFAICPECGEFDASFEELESGLVKCKKCGSEMGRREIQWKHVEY